MGRESIPAAHDRPQGFSHAIHRSDASAFDLYDLRFPSLYRNERRRLILAPSASPNDGKAHWETSFAPANENLVSLAPAQGGYHVNGRETHGDTMLVDPWGAVVDRLPRGSGVVIGAIDREHTARLRQSLPALTHRTLG